MPELLRTIYSRLFSFVDLNAPTLNGRPVTCQIGGFRRRAAAARSRGSGSHISRMVMQDDSGKIAVVMPDNDGPDREDEDHQAEDKE